MSEKIEKLISEWKKFSQNNNNNNCIKTALDEYNDFIDKYPSTQQLTLVEYTNLKPNDYFTDWVERKTKNCGALGATYSKFGIKKNAHNDNYKDTSTNQDFGDLKAATEYFTNKIFPQINMLKKYEGSFELTMDIRYARKVAYLYNVDKLIPIFSNAVIQRMAEFFNVKIIDIAPYKATEPILNEIKKVFEIGGDNTIETSLKLMQFLWAHFGNPVEDLMTKYLGKEQKAKNIILTGIPGTGKTHMVMEFLKSYSDDFEYEFVQFHPSYDYEDFIEGFKPISSNNGQIEFRLVNGVFKSLCKKAFESKKNNESKTFVMVIDEINRANLSRVFGELLYCLEYRDEFVSTKMTTYIQSLDKVDQENFSLDSEHIGKFSIPDNVIILGTMNEVDRSIDAFDLALRRRFIWEEVGFSEKAIYLYSAFPPSVKVDDLLNKASELNKQLKKEIGSNYQIGHTYYFKLKDYDFDDFNTSLSCLWDFHLKSIVREYLKMKFGESELEKKLEEYKKIITPVE